MDQEHQTYTGDNQDVDLTSYFTRAVSRAVRYYKLFVVLAGVFGFLTLLYVHTAQPVFTVVAALTPPKDALMESNSLSSGSGISSITRRLGIGGQSSGNQDLFDEYTRLLVSYRLATVLAQQPKFLSLAFPLQYDPQTKHLKQPEGTLNDVKITIKGVLGLPNAVLSDEDRIYSFLSENLSVFTPQVMTSDITEISFHSTNAAVGQQILEIILKEADTLMRNDKRDDIAARIAYLNNQLNTTTLEEQRQEILSLLAAQQYTMMIISADHRYASYVVEPPHTPDVPSWPNLSSMVGLALFLSLITWSLMIFLLPENSALLRSFSSDRGIAPRWGTGANRAEPRLSSRGVSEKSQ